MILAELEADILSEFPSFKTVPKVGSGLMKAINVFLIIISFGQNKKFLDKYTTTLGNTVYTSTEWDSWPELSRIIILRHERIHMRQSKKLTRVLFSFLYLVPFFPAFFAYGRMKLEMEAYEESLRAIAEYGGIDAIKDPVRRAFMITQFTGSYYAFMWIIKSTIEKWYDSTVTKIEKDMSGGPS